MPDPDDMVLVARSDLRTILHAAADHVELGDGEYDRLAAATNGCGVTVERRTRFLNWKGDHYVREARLATRWEPITNTTKEQ